jgi:hypothetical protein
MPPSYSKHDGFIGFFLGCKNVKEPIKSKKDYQHVTMQMLLIITCPIPTMFNPIYTQVCLVKHVGSN